MRTLLKSLVAGSFLLLLNSNLNAQSTAFTYQGQLNSGTNPANGSYDLAFTLFNASTNGTALGSVTNPATVINNGLFTVTLDFGAAFNGSNCWLELAVSTNGADAFSTLIPRQLILPVPQALYAANASNAAFADQANTAATATTATSIGGVQSANVAQLNISNTTVQAKGAVVVTSGFITSANVINGGWGYSIAPSVTIADVSGSNAVITATISNAVVTSLAIQNPGSHYSTNATLIIAPPISNAYQTFASGNIFTGANTFSNASGSFSGSFKGNGVALTNLNAAALSGINTLPATVLPSSVAFLNHNQTFTGVNIFNNNVGLGIAAPFRTFQIHPAANRLLGIYESGLTVGSPTTGMSIESVNDANTANQPLEFRGAPCVFTTGSVGIGTISPVSALDVNGTVTATAFTLNGNLTLPITTSSGGVIYSGGMTLLHAFGTENFFAGMGAGNLTLSGPYNTGIGYQALAGLTTGDHNTAIGDQALSSNTIGDGNTATGQGALFANTTGNGNTASGQAALLLNTTGSANTANGWVALRNNTTGNNNTATGEYALYNNTNGSYNTADGWQALLNNTTGNNNTATGEQALYQNTTGLLNTADGEAALWNNTTGNDNAAMGGAALFSNTNGNNNTASGYNALYSNTSGSYNTASGWEALQNNTSGNNNTATGEQALYSNTTGVENTANGEAALWNNSTGDYNTANGGRALFSNTNGTDNTANGFNSLYSNTSGYGNTASGFAALQSNTTGYDNTANGINALFANTTGYYNTASGFDALYANTTGINNIADGTFALQNNSIGSANTAVGYVALQFNTNGANNTAHGNGALNFNTSGSFNTAIGSSALQFNTVGSYNIAQGYLAGQFITTGSNNIAMGYEAAFNVITGNNNIEIGNQGTANDDSTIYIGTQGVQTNTLIAGIFGATAISGVPVYVNSTGQLGTLTSSGRFKTDIKSMDSASEEVFSLHPVTFRYKSEIDPQGIPQFGLVAEDVEKVDPSLVIRDGKHQIYTVRYEAVNAMLLNEFLKEHHRVEQQSVELDALKQSVAALNQLVQNLAERK